MLKGVIVIEGHVQGLANTRALGKAGIPVIVVSEYDCLAHYSRYCRKFFKCPPYLSEEFIDFLINLALTEGIKEWVLLPSNDHAVFNISSNIMRLQNHYRIISPKPDILKTIYNKELLIKLCESLEIPVPISWFPQELEGVEHLQLNFPLLIKGKNSLSFYKLFGVKVFSVVNTDDLLRILRQIKDKGAFSNTYLQNLLPLQNNKPISFTAFSIDGDIKTYWMGVKVREHPINFGTATYSRGINIPELVSFSDKLLKNLHYTGVCEIEYLLDPGDGKYKLIEVNARTWLWVDMAIKSGINYPLIIYNFLNNITMEYPQTYDSEKEWIHYTTDIPYSLIGLLRGRYSAGEILRSYLKLPSTAVFDSSDMMPSIAEIVLLPLLVFKR